MRVLLISPQFDIYSRSSNPEPPLGLVYLGSVLERSGYDVRILDAGNTTPMRNADGSFHYGLTDDEVLAAIEEFAPEIVGLGALFSAKWKYLVRIAKLVKEYNPNCITVAGGIYPSMNPEEALAGCDHLDFAFIGESEYTFLEFVKSIESNGGRADIDVLHTIEGLIYRAADGSSRYTPKVKFIDNLDELPFPNYDLIIGGLNAYRKSNLLGLGSHYLPLLTSRSCPNKCSFCNMRLTHGSRFRARAPISVVEEIKFMHAKHGISKFSVIDDNLTLNRERAKSIFEMILGLDFKIQWSAINGLMIATLDENLIALMGQTGCKLVAVPIESADQDIRDKVIGKPIPEEKIYRVVELLKKQNIFVQGMFIIGFLEDTEDVIEKNIAMVRRCKFNLLTVSPLQVYKGTGLFDRYQVSGKISRGYSLAKSEHELVVSNISLRSHYQEDLKRWGRKMYVTYLLSLFRHPWDLIKFHDVYFSARRLVTLFNILFVAGRKGQKNGQNVDEGV